MNFARLLVTTLVALTLLAASGGALFTPVPIPMPQYSHPASVHA